MDILENEFVPLQPFGAPTHGPDFVRATDEEQSEGGNGMQSEGGHGMDLDYLDEIAEIGIFQCLAVDTRLFRRERKADYRKIISEVYSPPRITKELSCLPNARLVPGYALDLTVVDPADGEPWDFSIASKRTRARLMLQQQRPMLVVGSPECRAYCTWNQLNRVRCSAEVAQRLEKENSSPGTPQLRGRNLQGSGVRREVLPLRAPTRRELMGRRVHRGTRETPSRHESASAPVPVRCRDSSWSPQRPADQKGYELPDEFSTTGQIPRQAM